jgi:hypothetical protein
MKSYINKSKLFFDIQKVFGIILFVIGCLGTMDAQLVVHLLRLLIKYLV